MSASLASHIERATCETITVNDSSNRFGMLELRERGSFYYCKFYRSLDRLNLSNIPTKATPL